LRCASIFEPMMLRVPSGCFLILIFLPPFCLLSQQYEQRDFTGCIIFSLRFEQSPIYCAVTKVILAQYGAKCNIFFLIIIGLLKIFCGFLAACEI